MSWESPHRLQFDNPARVLLIFITTRARTSVNLMPSLRMCVLFNVRQGILRGTEHHQRH
jgi:hypothetical protein